MFWGNLFMMVMKLFMLDEKLCNWVCLSGLTDQRFNQNFVLSVVFGRLTEPRTGEFSDFTAQFLRGLETPGTTGVNEHLP